MAGHLRLEARPHRQIVIMGKDNRDNRELLGKLRKSCRRTLPHLQPNRWRLCSNTWLKMPFLGPVNHKSCINHHQVKSTDHLQCISRVSAQSNSEYDSMIMLTRSTQLPSFPTQLVDITCLMLRTCPKPRRYKTLVLLSNTTLLKKCNMSYTVLHTAYPPWDLHSNNSSRLLR